MKKYFLYIALSLLSLNMFSDNVEQLIDSAQNSFMQTQYASALEMYDSVCRMGYSSSDLYYNIGNCYYRLNDIRLV